MSIRIPTLRTLMLCIFGYVGVVWLVYYRKSFFFDTENVEQIKLPMYKQKTMFPHFRNPSHLSQNSSCKRDMHCSCTFKGIFHIVCFSHLRLVSLQSSRSKILYGLNFPIYIYHYWEHKLFFLVTEPQIPLLLLIQWNDHIVAAYSHL